MTRVAIALGSNLGDRAATLRAAGKEIAEQIGTVVASSSLWETAPVGGPEQDSYLNGVVVVDTELPPRSVLDRLLEIERRHGRQRRERWGPRTLDLDLLLYATAQIDDPGLTVPHPRLTERRFVLEPLVEAWPDARLPSGEEVGSFLPAVADQAVQRWHDGAGPRLGVGVFLMAGTLAVAFWLLIERLVG